MSPERAHLLSELLKELADDPKGYIPPEAWDAARQAFSLSYIELAIIRRNPEGNVEILLTHRSDKDWKGWHIPGGVWRTRHTLEEGIASLTCAELGEGVELSLSAKGGWEKWLDNKQNRLISHIAVCSGTGITETATRKWFSQVPKGMINDHGHHAEFITTVLAQAKAESLV